MKKVNLFYSVCQYIPSLIRQESINFGIVVHCPESEYSEFYRTKNFNRIKHFDDEFDIDYLNMMAESLDYTFSIDRLHEDEFQDASLFNDIRDSSFIDERTKFYANEFRFLPTQHLSTTQEELCQDIEELKQTFLYYDQPKGERISTQEVRKLLSKQYKIVKLNKYISKTTFKDFADEPVFDFCYNDTVIKALSFDYVRGRDLIKQTKILSQDIIDNIEYLKGKMVQIVVDNEVNTNEETIVKSINKFYSISKKYNIDIEVVPLAEYSNMLISNGLK
ncbi:DUF3037 domain-containing protein [Enterococcus sp. UD-01]|jgi:hypothetical protein|uniref:DUF3037 domain-containing protein n=1 Tax=Enterococcus sp. UD-01 TaxID=3373911 RepID=UPI003836364F